MDSLLDPFGEPRGRTMKENSELFSDNSNILHSGAYVGAFGDNLGLFFGILGAFWKAFWKDFGQGTPKEHCGITTRNSWENQRE